MPEFRHNLALTYTSIGVVLESDGRLQEALDAYDRVIEVEEGLCDFLDEVDDSKVEFARALAGSYTNRGKVLMSLNRTAEAVVEFERAASVGEGLREQLTTNGDWTPKLRADLVLAYNNLAGAVHTQGRFAQATAVLDRAIAIIEGRGGLLDLEVELPPGNLDLYGTTYYARAGILRSMGRGEEAVESYERSIGLREDLRDLLLAEGQWTPKLRVSLAQTYSSSGNALGSIGRLDDAVMAHQQAVALTEQVRELLEETGEWALHFRANLAVSYSNLSIAFLEKGGLPAALVYWERAVDVIDALPEGVAIDVDTDRFTIYADGADLLDYIPDALSFSPRNSQRMAAFLERVPATKEDQSRAPELYERFALFHARWLAWCVRSGHLELIPEILAIVQGRELAAEVLDQLNLEDPRTPAEVRAFHELRLKLRKLNARIEAVIAGGRLGAGGAALSETAAWDRETYTALVAGHRALVEQIPDMRRAAARVRGYESLELPYRRLDLADLQGCLAPREALRSCPRIT